jgi:hypothetical protein
MQGGATGSGTVTLLAPVTNTNRTINLPDSNGTVLTTATAGVPVNGPAFSAYSASSQTVTANTWTKVVCGTELFDTNSNFASSRFTPTVAGYYQVSAGIQFNGTTITRVFAGIYKNGTEAQYFFDINLATVYRASGSCLLYMNGSTDYLEWYGFINGTGTLQFEASQQGTYFQAAMIRSAV